MKKIEVPLPQGVTAAIVGDIFKVRGKRGEISRNFRNPFATVTVEGQKVVVTQEHEKRKGKKMAETFAAHILNMIGGVTRGYKYEIQVVQTHFPIKVTATGQTVSVDNFLGEKNPRKVTLPKEVKIKIDGKSIWVEGNDLEVVSHAAHRLEVLTRVTARDRRVFQDGLYITQKAVPVE